MQLGDNLVRQVESLCRGELATPDKQLATRMIYQVCLIIADDDNKLGKQLRNENFFRNIFLSRLLGIATPAPATRNGTKSSTPSVNDFAITGGVIEAAQRNAILQDHESKFTATYRSLDGSTPPTYAQYLTQLINQHELPLCVTNEAVIAYMIGKGHKFQTVQVAMAAPPPVTNRKTENKGSDSVPPKPEDTVVPKIHNFTKQTISEAVTTITGDHLEEAQGNDQLKNNPEKLAEAYEALVESSPTPKIFADFAKVLIEGINSLDSLVIAAALLDIKPDARFRNTTYRPNEFAPKKKPAPLPTSQAVVTTAQTESGAEPEPELPSTLQAAATTASPEPTPQAAAPQTIDYDLRQALEKLDAARASISSFQNTLGKTTREALNKLFQTEGDTYPLQGRTLTEGILVDLIDKLISDSPNIEQITQSLDSNPDINRREPWYKIGIILYRALSILPNKRAAQKLRENPNRFWANLVALKNKLEPQTQAQKVATEVTTTESLSESYTDTTPINTPGIESRYQVDEEPTDNDKTVIVLDAASEEASVAAANNLPDETTSQRHRGRQALITPAKKAEIFAAVNKAINDKNGTAIDTGELKILINNILNQEISDPTFYDFLKENVVQLIGKVVNRKRSRKPPLAALNAPDEVNSVKAKDTPRKSDTEEHEVTTQVEYSGPTPTVSTILKGTLGPKSFGDFCRRMGLDQSSKESASLFLLSIVFGREGAENILSQLTNSAVSFGTASEITTVNVDKDTNPMPEWIKTAIATLEGLGQKANLNGHQLITWLQKTCDAAVSLLPISKPAEIAKVPAKKL